MMLSVYWLLSLGLVLSIACNIAGAVEDSHSCSDLSFDTCEPSTEEKIVVCYFTNWAWYRSGLAKYGPESINASLCTHIIYAFATLDNETLTIAPYDPYVDLENKFYEQVVELKKKGLKVLCGIGGWNDSGFEKWSLLLRNATARTNFVNSTMEFLDKHGFQGLDVDYEYPGCPKDNRTAAHPDDIKNFNALMSELKEAFAGEFLLTAATGGKRETIDECYDMGPLCEVADWVNVMTYDYHSYLDNATGANAPICGSGDQFGVFETIQHYTKVKGCAENKLVLGLPFYAKSYTLNNTAPEFGVATSGPGGEGEYTKSPGFLAYYEVCQAVNNDYHLGYSRVNGSYLWKDDQFIAFESVSTVVKKTCLINKYFNLRGAMFWSLDYDDFSNVCGCGSHPLLMTLNQQMGRLPSYPAVSCY